MKLSEKIKVIAEWLESNENEILEEASENPEILEQVAETFVQSADKLHSLAEIVSISEPTIEENQPTVFEMSPEKLEELAAVAEAFDASGDPLLQKQASVLDEILLTIAAPKDYIFNFKKAEQDKIDQIKKKYLDTREEFQKEIKAEETLQQIKESDVYKEYRPLEAALSSRSCPDHHGQQLYRVEQDIYRCQLDQKTYNWQEGFTLLDGSKVSPGSVSEQTPSYFPEDMPQVFDTREARNSR